MAEKKYSAFALLDILITYTDEDHILTAKELQNHLIEKYDLDLERRTIYSNMDILEQNGFISDKLTILREITSDGKSTTKINNKN